MNMTQENKIISRLFFKSSLLRNDAGNADCNSYVSNDSLLSTVIQDGESRSICFKNISPSSQSEFYTTEITITTTDTQTSPVRTQFVLTITNSNFQVFGRDNGPVTTSIRLTDKSALTMNPSVGTWRFKNDQDGNPGNTVNFTDYFNSEWKNYVYCSFPVSFLGNGNIETILNPFQPNDSRLSIQGACEINGEMIEKILSDILSV